MAVAGKPLRLKDFLELDCDSCSAAGFRCYPRHLCVAPPLPARRCHLQLEAEAPRFGRSPSLRPTLSHISKSLSRRLKDGFSSWRRHEDETAPPVPEPCAPPEVAASCSSSVSETSESRSSSVEGKSESDFSSASSESLLHAGATQATAAAVHEAMERGSKEATSSEGDEKEQLSPMAVMDFPFDDYDDAVVDEEGSDSSGGASSSASFSDMLAQLQRRKTQVEHKIRRRLGSIVEVGAVDLVTCFAASDSDGLAGVATGPSCPKDGHGSDEQRLHGLLTATAVGVDGISERLLLDFFTEMALANLSSSESGEAAVRLAKNWLEGTRAQWSLKDVLCCREDFVAGTGMELNRRWPARVGEEEERNVGVVVASLLADELVGELLRDLAV